MYILKDRNNKTVERADCIYDFNGLLRNPFPEPEDGDWHSIDDDVQKALKTQGLFVHEARR